MTTLLAAEGGYQVFDLKGGEFAWLFFSVGTALLAIIVGFSLMKGVLAADKGTEKMQEIAMAIQEGALAYLRRQFKTVGIILMPLVIIVFLTSTAVAKPDDTEALSFLASGTFRTLAFLAGCIMSGLTGFIGMSLAVRGNVRTAAAAKSGSLPAALKVAFRTGGVAGMFTVGLGLLGATIIILLFQNTASAILVGFGFGGSLLALFLRVGGGIFTKAADVGADLVGKVEQGLNEDDPRNPAVVADLVGDNVGDCAGMAADIFESYEVTMVSGLILGLALWHITGELEWIIYPLIVRGIGVISSIIGTYVVRAPAEGGDAMKAIFQGFLSSAAISAVLFFVAGFIYLNTADMAPWGGWWRAPLAVFVGVVLAIVIDRLTEYFTGTHGTPVKEIKKGADTGPATLILQGLSAGYESSVWSALVI
ncbi:MAG TPA: sodium/proton-translocating pyrophosphatase, partial [Acidimicrobiales bacterium]|nr:sodium/proton-translocating pyrophosphatase [Acidimicrobiales bacterium]